MVAYLAAIGFLLVMASALANTDQQTEAESTPKFYVKEIVVEGENPISDRKMKSLLQGYKNKQMDIEELQKAASEVEQLFATSGYNFYRATLPPQQLDGGSVRVNVERAEISKVYVTGNQFFKTDNIKRSLPLVVPNASPNTQHIASAMLLAESNPAKELRVVFVKGEAPQSIDANITVTDRNPNELYFWANNSGSRRTTEPRMGGQYHHRNLWGHDHQLSLSYSFSPEETSEVRQYGVNYKIPIYPLRGMIGAFYSKSDADTGRVADVFDVSGAGETVGLSYTHYLDKRGEYQSRLKVGVLDKLFESNVLFRDADIGTDVRSRPAFVEYINRYDRENWTFNGTVTHFTNMSSGLFNDDESYGNAAAGAGANWSKQTLSARLNYRISRDWRARISAYAQTTSDVLISGEKFGLGGALGSAGPRGFYEREVSTDKGAKASVEFIRDFSTRRMQIGAFADVGWGRENNPQIGEAPKESLSSIGLIYTWQIRPTLRFTADYGYVLSGINQEFSDDLTDDGDSRLHVSLQYTPRWPFGGDQ